MEQRSGIFTEYRDTQNSLFGSLTREGFGGDRLATLYGGMAPEKREAVKAAFQYDPTQSPVRILFATDAPSEGIDLQNWCHLLIHYEIPWNPARLEQRNGRVDRHGQRAPMVLVHHFVARGFKENAQGVTKPGELEGPRISHARRYQGEPHSRGPGQSCPRDRGASGTRGGLSIPGAVRTGKRAGQRGRQPRLPNYRASREAALFH
jgi:superfamily II DNA/RNA helicase